MIKLFRDIHKKLLAEGKTTNYRKICHWRNFACSIWKNRFMSRQGRHIGS
ncbi:hypothetical protein [Confluentibacter flavum]|nr:hypothetical protein [Confluentibacter flavum]